MPVPSARPLVVSGDVPADVAAAFRAAGMVAWDTETSGLDPTTDRLQLCQIFARDVGTVLVQVQPGTPRNLVDLLGDPSIVTVMHHAPFDLRFMRAAWGAPARSVRCTKIASRLLAPLAPRSSHSLAALSASRLGRPLTKGAVRTSDWGAPSLSPEQIAYAAGDVTNLLDLYEILTKELNDRSLTEVYDACCAFLPTHASLAASGIKDVFAY